MILSVISRLFSFGNIYFYSVTNCIATINIVFFPQTSDIIGGLRPVRGRSQLIVQAAQEIENALILLTDLKEVRDVVDVKNQNQSGEVEEVDKGDEKSFATIAHTFLLNIRILIPLSSIQIVDETQIRSALDQLNSFIKDATSFLKNPTSEEGEENGKGKGKDISPVPLKKIKRERGGVPVAAASKISKEIDSEIGILNSMAACVQSAEILWQRSKSLFEWQDGPLVTAMKEGDMFVLDEINLAEDAVIERLNSALESGREITLAEKGGLSSEKIVAHPNFKFLATMNPGGDFGKRELSPALRSRFTEMWIPSANSGADIALIVAEILHLDERCGLSSLELSGAMVRFMVWLNRHSSSISMKGLQISVREVLAWAKFISAWHPLTMGEAYAGLLHGAHMVLLDGLGIGLSTPREIIRELKEKAVEELLNECDESVRDDVYRSVYPSSNSHPSRNIQGLRNDQDHNNSEISSRLASRAEITEDGRFTLGGVGFSISMGPNYFQSMENGTTKARNLQMKTSVGDNNYILTAQSVTENMRRILRAMQLPRPILLEGPPGVGKTSLISNLAKLTGHNLVRINLSEHSEISDLLGSDLPAPLDYDHEMISVENNVGTSCERNSSSSTSGPKFVWCDGVFLTALKKGDWVLLDELNLAPQSVLEGLNACLDHRGEVFLPEIGQAFSCPPSFRVFCAQNPAGEGGGRKGLPQSFLTRFSRVFVEEMDERDMRDIAIQAYSTMSDIAPSKNSNSSSSNSSSSESVINESKIFVEPTDQEIVACVSTLNASNSLVIHFLPQMVKFTRQLQSDIVDNHLYGNVGSPWEFNLRDIFRWCELIQSNSTALPLSGSALGVTSVEVTPRVVTATEMYILGDAAYMLFFSRLRTRADREGASRAFFTVFGWTPQPDYTPSIQLVGDSNILIGLALLPKNVYTRGSGRGLGFNGEEGPMGYQSNPLLLAGLGKVVEVLAHCVALRWPALLIGQSGSGKRRSLRQLAAVTGTSLVEFSATASTDSTDLLGSFEQASAYRHLRFGLEFLDFAAGLLLPLREILFGSTVTLSTAGAYEAVSKAILLHEHVQRDAEVVIVTASLRLKLGGELFGVLQDTLQAISNALVIMRSELSISSIMRNMKIADAENDLILARNCFDKCYHDCNSNIDGKGGEISGFEWVDGVVVTALKNGHWLLIDNVNLCPASVLDRLNSLLEPNGTLLLTESGAGTILIPHADFRIFFAMDPSHGEISRAMRNRCVEMSMLMEGDCEVAAAYLLSLTSSSSIPLLPSTAPVSVTEGFTDVNSQSLLVPLCDIYGLLAAPVSEIEDSTHKSQLLDVKGSLSAAGLSAAVYPRFRMFARLTRLVAIECRNGKNPRESLQSSVKSVLPFFSIATLASTDSERDDIDKTKRVRNMSVDEDSVEYSGFKNPDSASVSSRILGKVLSSPHINLLPCEVRANLVLLVALSNTLALKKAEAEAEGEGIRSEGLAWLQRASRSVRDRSNRDYSAFVLGADARSAQIVRKEGDGDVEAANRALVDADGLAFVTTLQILSEMEDEVLCTDFDQQISLEAFIMALLVRSSAAQSDIIQTIVHSLLIDAGFVAQALSFSYWISFTMTSPQLELLTPTIFSNILSGSRKFFSVPSSVSASALHMLLGRKDSTSSSLGAVVAAVSLSASANTGSSSSIRALEFATTCVQLLDIAIFDRWIVLDEEYRQRCEVDNAISLSSDSNLPSLFALAYALHRKRIVADSSELQVLLSVYAALLVADMVLSNITQELSTSSPTATHNSDFCLSARSMHILRKLLDRRDMLSRVLSSCSAPSDRGAMRIPWEEIIVCVRWVKKGVSALMDSVQHSLNPVSMTKGREVGDSDNNGDAFLKICTSAHIELSQFDRALGEYWNRPVLLGMNQSLSLTLSSATSKLRLWKEGGHAAVPSRLEEWCTLQALRRIVQPIKRRLPSFVDTQIDTVQVVDDGSSVCPTNLRREWLCLYSTFYWMHTNESSSCISAYSNCTDTRAPTLVPSQSRSIDVKALVTALQSQFTTAVGGDKTSCSSSALPQMEMTANSGESDMYGDADYPLLADKEAAERVRDEWRHAGELSVSILLEPIVISSLFGICNSLSVFMKHHSVQTVAPITSSAHSPINGLGELRGRTEELQLLSAQLSSIVSLAVRYTLFDLGDFRELQTLLWSVEAVLTLLAECSMPVVNAKKAPKNAKKLRDIELFNAEKQFLSLARVFSVQFEVRLNSLLTNNLVCCMDAVNFTYSSPTLKAILEPTLDGPNLQSGLGPLGSLTMTQVTIPWSWTLSTGMLRLLQPTGIETALRHVDARALYSHSIAGAGTVSALVGGGAVVTVATCGNALGRLLQLFRLTATTSAPPCASLMRLRLLGQHTTDVLTSIRDFLTVEGYSHISEVIVRKYADNSDACSFYQELLDLNIAGMSNSSYIAELLTTCLYPILDVLANEELRMKPLENVPQIGRSWMLVGLLRLYLVLPQTPVDPATKSAVKAQLLSVETQLKKIQMHATHLQAVLSGKPHVTTHMASTAVLVRTVEQQVTELSARAVQRPVDAPHFEEVFAELRGACDGLANIDRILALDSRTTEAYAELQQSCRSWVEATKHVGSHGRKGTKEHSVNIEKARVAAAVAFDALTVCAREELGWQGSVSAFIERCGTQFSMYEDVTSPVIAAMHNLSSGVRLSVGWCYGQAEDLMLALSHSQTARQSDGLLGEKTGETQYSASEVIARGWKGVLMYPHSSSICLSGTRGDQVSAEALKCVHSLLQCSDLLAARAFKSISDMRSAQGELKTRTKIAPNPLLIDKICPQAALLLSLARLDYLVGGGTAACSSAKGLFRQVLERFVHAYLKAEDDRKKQAALKAALYQNKAEEKVFESDDVKEELVALRLHFPDHLSEFRDITDTARGPDGETLGQLRDEDDDEVMEKENVDIDTENEECELSLSVDPQTAALLVGYHCRMVFLHITQQLKAVGKLWVLEGQQCRTVHVGQREALDSALTSCSLMTAKGLEWGLRRLLSPGSEGALRGGAMNALSFMTEKCNPSTWGTGRSSSSSSSSVSWIERLTGISTTQVSHGKGNRRKLKRRKGVTSETAAEAAVSKIDRDLLLLLDPSAEGSWHPKDFNADPHPEEVMLAAEPLRKLFDRATEVLQLYPGNELLVQVCKVAARISELHTSTPVGKLLMTVQLLLVKAQEWEQFAAMHVSLHVEMAGLSVLIGRWRELELKSWGQLLRCKEQSYVQTAMMYWFSLARSLNSHPQIEASTAVTEVSSKDAEVERKRREQWPGLADVTPNWLCAGFISESKEGLGTGPSSLFEGLEDVLEQSKISAIPLVKMELSALATPKIQDPTDARTGSIYGDADGTAAHSRVFAKKFLNDASKREKMTRENYLSNIFEILNSFLKRAVVGEFPTRLHLVRLFALQLHQDTIPECNATSTATAAATATIIVLDDVDHEGGGGEVDGVGEGIESSSMPPSLKRQLARMVMGVWRYYQQFLSVVRRFQDILREPIERRLKGEVKIGKWDQLSTYGLIEHSERVHKKLNKVCKLHSILLSMITVLCLHLYPIHCI